MKKIGDALFKSAIILGIIAYYIQGSFEYKTVAFVLSLIALPIGFLGASIRLLVDRRNSRKIVSCLKLIACTSTFIFVLFSSDIISIPLFLQIVVGLIMLSSVLLVLEFMIFPEKERSVLGYKLVDLDSNNTTRIENKNKVSSVVSGFAHMVDWILYLVLFVVFSLHLYQVLIRVISFYFAPIK